MRHPCRVRLLGELVLTITVVLAIIELLVLGAARAATAHAEKCAWETESASNVTPNAPAIQTTPTESEVTRELDYKVVLLPAGSEDTYPDTGRNDMDELRGFDGKLENCNITYYCCEQRPHICGGGTGKTATGTDVTAGRSAAVDPSVIPLGAEIFVDYGDGVLHSYIAEDTGSAVLGGHIDLAVQTHEEALELGTAVATVWWIK